MFWSYAPLVGLGTVAAAFAIKMPIEVSIVSSYIEMTYSRLIILQEELIMKDPGVGAEYRAYMERVPARLIPFVW